MNLSLMRSTDLPNCKDIKMPGPAGIREEIQIQLRTQAYLDTVDEYLHQNCDSRGVSECSEVLTPREKAGLDEIRDGITNKGWMI